MSCPYDFSFFRKYTTKKRGAHGRVDLQEEVFGGRDEEEQNEAQNLA
jgi:hypothetical protein